MIIGDQLVLKIVTLPYVFALDWLANHNFRSKFQNLFDWSLSIIHFFHQNSVAAGKTLARGWVLSVPFAANGAMMTSWLASGCASSAMCWWLLEEWGLLSSYLDSYRFLWFVWAMQKAWSCTRLVGERFFRRLPASALCSPASSAAPMLGVMLSEGESFKS